MASTSTVTCEVVLETLREAIVDLGAEPELVTREASFEVLDLDSLDLVEIREVIDERFEVTLQREQVAELRTVGDVADLVVRLAG